MLFKILTVLEVISGHPIAFALHAIFALTPRPRPPPLIRESAWEAPHLLTKTAPRCAKRLGAASTYSQSTHGRTVVNRGGGTPTIMGFAKDLPMDLPRGTLGESPKQIT